MCGDNALIVFERNIDSSLSGVSSHGQANSVIKIEESVLNKASGLKNKLFVLKLRNRLMLIKK